MYEFDARGSAQNLCNLKGIQKDKVIYGGVPAHCLKIIYSADGGHGLGLQMGVTEGGRWQKGDGLGLQMGATEGVCWQKGDRLGLQKGVIGGCQQEGDRWGSQMGVMECGFWEKGGEWCLQMRVMEDGYWQKGDGWYLQMGHKDDSNKMTVQAFCCYYQACQGGEL